MEEVTSSQTLQRHYKVRVIATDDLAVNLVQRSAKVNALGCVNAASKLGQM